MLCKVEPRKKRSWRERARAIKWQQLCIRKRRATPVDIDVIAYTIHRIFTDWTLRTLRFLYFFFYFICLSFLFIFFQSACSRLVKTDEVIPVPAIIAFDIHYCVWMLSQLRYWIQCMANYMEWINQECGSSRAKHAVIIIRNNLSNQWSAVRVRTNCKWYRQAKCHIKYWWPL